MAYRALYRKYRPKGFADIVGQPALVQALRAQVAAGRVSHAYLFSGPRGTGKTSAAKVLARAINCEAPIDGEACGCCRPCVELLTEANMDVVEIDAASNNSVDKVREMLENVKYMPAVGRFRVYIVDEVHMLSTSAFNALLKTLEEPPAHVVFILATTEPQKLPATVLSRCQQFQFRRIGAGEMVALLRNVLNKEGGAADDEALHRIARAADGGMRDALSLLDQCLSTKDTVTVENVAELLGSADSDCTFRVAEAILSQDAAGAIDGFNDFLAAGGDCRVFAADLSLHLRDLIVAHHAHNAAQVLDVSADTAARLIKQAKAHAPGDILRALGELIELDGALRYAANPRIPVELALLRCCRMEQPGSYEALLTRVERLEKQLQNGVATAPFAQPVDKAPTASPTEEQKTPARSVPETSKAKEEPKGSPKLVPEAPKAQEGAKPPVDDLPPWEVPPPTEEPSRAPAPVEDIPPWEEASPPPAPSRPMGGSALARAAATLSGLPEQETPKAEKEAKQPAEEGTKPPGDANAAKLWRNVVDGLNRKGLPHLVGFAGKGRGTAWDGETLTVSFTQDDRGSADMLGDERRMAKLTEVASEVCGRPVRIQFEVSLWSPAEQRFIQQSREALGPNTTIIIEKD